MNPEMYTAGKRLRILGNDEIEALYGRPQFTPEDRVQHFGLSHPERILLGELRSIKSQIYFILQLGYFKAKRLFFTFELHQVNEDLQYILKHYFPNQQIDGMSAVNKRTLLKQRQAILALYNYRSCDGKARQKVESKARQAAMVCSKPVYIFRQLIQYLTEQCIAAPGYSFMQTTVGLALTYEQNRLITLVQNHLTESDIEALNHLLDDSQGLHEITQLKRDPKNFSTSEIKREIHRGEQIHPLYQLAKRILPSLKISNESIKYYATLVTYYSVFRLKRFDEQIVHLYLLCFVYHRYQRFHDNLLNSLIQDVRGYVDDALSAAKDRVYAYRIEVNSNLQKAGQVLKLFTDDTITENTAFVDVQTKAFKILDRQKLEFIADHINTKAQFDETAFAWEHIDKLALQFKRHLRPILLAVDISTSQAYAPLMKAVDFLQQAYQKGKPLSQYSTDTFPVKFIPSNIKRYLYQQDAQGQKRLLVDRYEFFVYRRLRDGLQAGDIFCRDSVRFRSLEDDLIDVSQWQKKKDELIATTGLTILNQPIEDHLAALEQMLEERIISVNQRIMSGENEHFKFKTPSKQRGWTLVYPSSSDAVNHLFFDTLRQVDIGDVLHFVNQQCHFMDAFEHVLGRYSRHSVDNRILTACLVAWATNMGLGKMSENSDIGYHALAGMSDNFIRLETLKNANDYVSNAIAELPIFQYYDIGGATHSSSDGQKFETQIHTINARYSPKYFGLKKGIVSYTLIANHIPINAQVISANEHESHYVFDVLFNNTTNIEPKVHSTDTHGTNEVNFAILHLFGYQFAPRYKDIYDKVTTSLYSFSHPSQYEGMPLVPIRKINPNLIIDEWENVQRIMVSLALKETTQNIIIRKLSAHARKNKTKRALWEYDNIIQSLYLLDFIDSPPLRQNVHKALNRGENYHKLRRAVSYANFGKLRFKTEYEQQLWNECSRLITNCIIFYNATILSTLLAYKEENDDNLDLTYLKKISPVAWQHLNFHGRYEFNKDPEDISINAIVEQLASIQSFS